MEPIHYNYRDILWAPVKAFSAKQIFVMTFFLLLALSIYDLFYYLANLVEGENLGFIFSAYGFFPFEQFGFDKGIALVIFVFGAILTLIFVMLGVFAVAAIQIEQIRGNRFFSNRQAIKFAFKRFWQIFLSEAAIVLFVIFIMLVFALLGLIARIPYIGEWLFAVTFFIPNFILAILTVFIIFIFTLSVGILPAAAAAERHGEAFTSILETFSTVMRQPARWFAWTAYSLVAAKVCSFIYAYFCFRAIQFVQASSAIGGGEKVRQLVKMGYSHLPLKAPLVKSVFTVFPGVDFGFNINYWLHGGHGEIVGYVMSVMLFLIFATIIGYFFAILAAAQARIYVVIRYLKDDHKIGEETSLFFKDEHINPEIE